MTGSLSTGFFRQECWNGLPFSPPRTPLHKGLNPHLSSLLHCKRILYAEPSGKSLSHTSFSSSSYCVLLCLPFFLRVSHCCNILSSATQKKFSFGPTYTISYCFIFLLPYVAKFFKIAVYSLSMVAFFINLLQEGLCSITAQEHLLLPSSLILCC